MPGYTYSPRRPSSGHTARNATALAIQPVQDVLAKVDADRANFDEQFKKDLANPHAGTTPDPDGYIRYKFSKATQQERERTKLRAAIVAGTNLRHHLIAKYRREVDHISLFHYAPLDVEEDLLRICPYSLRDKTCPRGKTCSLVPVCSDKSCPSSARCQRPHLRVFCADVETRHNRSHRGSCGYLHLEDVEVLIENQEAHRHGHDEKMEALRVKEGGWISSVLKASRQQ